MDTDEIGSDACENSENYSNEEEENSSGEDSGEGSDDEETEGGTEALSDEDDEDGETDAESDDDEDGTSSVTVDETGAVGSASDDEETQEEEEEVVLPKVEDADMSCPICLNVFDGQDLGSPENCNHTFCLECIVEWSKNVNTCPFDRIEFHLIYMKHEVNGDVVKKIKVRVKKEEDNYVEEVTLCEVCRQGDREDRLLLCDSCDSGYHCECLDPPLDTIPIEEWFCPPCAHVMNRRGGSSHSSHSRLIARTSASEIVRSRIQNHRAANSEDSSSETTAQQQPHSVRVPSLTPRRRKTTRRKTRRKTTRKSSSSKTTKARTKATSAGKSKAAKKGTTKTTSRRRRKTKRRKSRKTKKKSRRSWLASMKLVAPSVKKRIADHLGLCKPPPGHTMPFVKKSSSQRVGVVEQPPSFDMFGCRAQLFEFGESYTEESLEDPRPSTSTDKKQPNILRKNIAVASTSGLSLLDNILETQNVLLQSSKNVTIGKDGSLSLNESSLSIKTKCEIKSKPKSEETSLPSESLKGEVDCVSSSSSPKTEDKETDDSAGFCLNVKKEKRSPSPEPSFCSKRIKLDEMPSSSVPIRKERERLRPRVRFDDETVFAIEKREKCKRAAEARFLSSTETCPTNFPFSETQVKDGHSLGTACGVKKEKNDDLSLDSLVDMESFDDSSFPSSPLFDMHNETHKEGQVSGGEAHRDSILCSQLLKASSSPILSDTQKQNHVVNNLGTNKLSFLSSSINEIDLKDGPSFESQGEIKSSKSVSTNKTKESSASSYDKAENDRKRHLPFLLNGIQRPFKIPKLAKRTDGNLISSGNTPSSEASNKPEDIRVSIKSEGGAVESISTKPVLVKESLESEAKSQNYKRKHALVEPSHNVKKEFDPDVHMGPNKHKTSPRKLEGAVQALKPALMKECLQSDVKSQNSRKLTLGEHINNIKKEFDPDVHMDRNKLRTAPIKSESAGKTLKPELIKESLQSDVKSQNNNRKLTLGEHINIINKTSDINTHMDPDKHALHKNSCNSQNHTLLPVSTSSSSKDNQVDDKNNLEGTAVDSIINSPEFISHLNTTDMKSEHKHIERKPHNRISSTSSDSGRSRNSGRKKLVERGGVKCERTLSEDKSPVLKNTEFRGSSKALEKGLSKHKMKELIVDEIKKHLKDFYVTDLITKEEYKEIMRRSVPKVLLNCGNSIDSGKIKKLVVSYVHLVGNAKSACS